MFQPPVQSSPVLLVPGMGSGDQRVEITGSEANHGIRARRLRPGDALTVINGVGLLGEGQVIEINLRENFLTAALDTLQLIKRPRPQITLASALPKGDRLSTMLDMATQLGMDSFIPLDCDYSVVRYQSRMRQRWQRVVESAAKQCRNAWLPTFEPAMSVQHLLDHSAEGALVLFGDRYATHPNVLSGNSNGIAKLIVLVGPEGGFSAAEQSLLETAANAHATAIGRHVLRTETAAVALMTNANLVRRYLESD